MAILIPEVQHPAVQELAANNDTGLDLLFEQATLDQSVERLANGDVEALIIGATYPTATVLRAAIDELGTYDGVASGFFIMEKDGEQLFFADCAVNPAPDDTKLIRIAEQTCDSVKRLGTEPVVAFLSFSTYGSAATPENQRIAAITEAFAKQNPTVETYGEIQFDAAYDEKVYALKTGSELGSRPNVFIFPDLNSANISYKIAERLAGYVAIGPILQGFKRPIFDLSRGVDAVALKEICRVVDRLK